MFPTGSARDQGNHQGTLCKTTALRCSLEFSVHGLGFSHPQITWRMCSAQSYERTESIGLKKAKVLASEYPLVLAVAGGRASPWQLRVVVGSLNV
jgi:hypothetical protein